MVSDLVRASVAASSWEWSSFSVGLVSPDSICVQKEVNEMRINSASGTFIELALLLALPCRSSLTLTVNCFSFDFILTSFGFVLLVTQTFMSLSRYVLFVILVTGDIPSEGAVTVNVYSEKPYL